MPDLSAPLVAFLIVMAALVLIWPVTRPVRTTNKEEVHP